MRSLNFILIGVFAILSTLSAQATDSSVDELETMVTAMAKVGASNSASFSPDGKQIALISTLSGPGQVWTMSSQGGWPNQVTSLEGNTANSFWSPDGQWIVFHYVPPKGGQQVCIIRPDGTGFRCVTDGGEETNFTDGWSPDSRFLMIASNRRAGESDGKSIDAYIYDMQRNELRLVSATPALEELVAITGDGKRGLLYRQGSRGDNNLILVDLATRAETVLTPHTPPSLFERSKFAVDDSAVYLTTNDKQETHVVARIKLDAQGRPSPLEVIARREGSNAEQLALSPDGKSALVSWNVAGRSELHFLDLTTLEQSAPILLPNDIVGQIKFSPDGKDIAFLFVGSAAPPNLWMYNLEAGTFRQITFSSHPGVDLSKIVRPELLTFKAHDGLDVSGWVYRPQGAQGQLPLVIMIHGGPEGQERPTFLGTYQALVQRGIMVFGLNPRGSTGFGKKFTHLDNGALRANAVHDVKSAVEALVAKGLVDPKRVGVVGFSSGGLLALGAITRYPDSFQAGALVSGLVDLEGFFARTEPWMASISKSEYGDPEKDVQILRELSPINKIDSVNAPLLVIHGALDTNVPVDQADRVVDSLKRRNVPVQYLRFPDERHGVGELKNRIQYSVSMVKWFEAHLKASSSQTSSNPAAHSSSER